jgi:hypothetical protein
MRWWPEGAQTMGDGNWHDFFVWQFYRGCTVGVLFTVVGLPLYGIRLLIQRYDEMKAGK